LNVQVEILLFASSAQLAGTRAITVEVDAPATVADLTAALERAAPQLSHLLPISRWAIDQQFVPTTATIQPGQEIALIPPVSGG
jgi:sulfur-carrier protein